MNSSILIVEDDPDIQASLKLAFEGHPFHILTASNGREALKQLALSPKPPNLILLDWQMPVMNGSEFLKALPHVEKPTPAVLIVSANAQSIVPETDHPAVAGLIQKPFDIFALITLVHQYCDARKHIH